MIEFVVLGLVIIVGFVILLFSGLTKSRMNELENELEDWSGVMDVRRKTRDNLDNDPDYVERVQNKFND